MFDILFNKDTVVQTFNSYIKFDCEGYALSDTFFSHFLSCALAAEK